MTSSESDILNLVIRARQDFESGRVFDDECDLLERLYTEYTHVPEVQKFLRSAKASFPRGNCGLTSVYFRHKFATGELIQGSYNGQNHTLFQLHPKSIILDITADQFGGSSIYLGHIIPPWSLKGVIDVE